MDIDVEPYTDADVAAVLHDLVRNQELLALIAGWRYPRLSRALGPLATTAIGFVLRRHVRDISSIAQFQEMIATYVKALVRETMTSFSVDGIRELDPDAGYLFLSNHRDIAGDSMLLNYALYLEQRKTLRIAVGDNLDQKSFATDLMRLNKSFFINRTGTSPRRVYRALQEASQYIARSRAEAEPVWLAQSEGRAKDGMDRTEAAVLKMLLMNQRKQPVAEAVNQLGIVPTTLSYEFDPCDTRKARELSMTARDGSYQKAPGEDLDSLVTGLAGFKGRVTLRVGPPFRTEAEDVDQVAKELDQEILSRLELYPINHWAAAELVARGDPDFLALAEALAVSCPPNPDPDGSLAVRFAACPTEHQAAWLRIYANPVLAKLGGCQR